MYKSMMNNHLSKVLDFPDTCVMRDLVMWNVPKTTSRKWTKHNMTVSLAIKPINEPRALLARAIAHALQMDFTQYKDLGGATSSLVVEPSNNCSL